MVQIQRLIRHLQGERPGMGAGFRPEPLDEELTFLLFPDTIFSPTVTIQNAVQLADVSFWQEEIDFVVMKAAGLSGVIIRAGQRNWVDSRFKVNWQKAREAILPRGSYWFYDSREDPKKQAELWWSLIKDDPGELVHAADFEESYGGPYGTKAHFKQFLLRLQELGLSPDRIVIYTGFYWWLKRIGDDPFIVRFALWLAWYAAMSLVRVPPPWSEPDLIFWQHTASGSGPAYGVSSLEIDLNWYCCDLVAFQKRFPYGSIEPLPNGDPMTDYFYSITPTGSLGCKVRPEPDTGNTALSISLPFGKFAYGNKKLTIAENKYEEINGVSKQVNQAGDIWLEVLEVNGTVLGAPAYVAEIHLGQRYATIKQITPIPEPDPEPTEDIVITQTFSSPGYTSQTVTTILKPE